MATESATPTSTPVKDEEVVDEAALGAEDSELKAVKQIEFYFDDSNLPYDKFMWTLHTANEEHWVPIATVASFKRMKEFKSLGIPWLANALKTRSSQLDVDEKLENVRRKTEVVEVRSSDQMERSIYAKGFGEERPTLQTELEEYFSKYGTVRALRMRRMDNTKEFKGSVFVEFDSPSTAKSFLSSEPKPQWDGKDLLIYSKYDYCEMKIQEKGLKGKAADFRRESLAFGTGRGRGFNAFREAEKAKKQESNKEKKKPEIVLDFMGKRIKVLEEEGEFKINEEEYESVPNATLRFDGCKGECRWSDIKDALREHFTKAPFVKFQDGDDYGFVGFHRELNDEDLEYVKDHVKTVGGSEVTWSYADDESNRTYQIERANAAAQRAGSAVGVSTRGKGSRGRGRNRGSRPQRGGGGGGRVNGGHMKKEKNKEDADDAKAMTKGPEAEAGTGQKRVRGIEPDGGITQGVRGESNQVPSIQSTAKKAKLDEGS